MGKILRKPEWIRLANKRNESYHKVGEMLIKYNLNTVCEAARCPNRRECYNSGTATFMLMGNNCTRNCAFCNVTMATPQPIDQEEPMNVAKAVKELGISHVVITSVTRDDLKDGGAEHFVKTIDAIRAMNNDVTIEVLIPDFQGDMVALRKVIDAKPDVINHNVETIPELYKDVRPMAVFERSIELLDRVKKWSDIPTKTGFMLGLGESREKVYELLRTLRAIDCDIVTIGQYLQPTREHYQLQEYIHPDVFREYYEYAKSIGFRYVVSSPLTRSSYKAQEELDYI